MNHCVSNFTRRKPFRLGRRHLHFIRIDKILAMINGDKKNNFELRSAIA